MPNDNEEILRTVRMIAWALLVVAWLTIVRFGMMPDVNLSYAACGALFAGEVWTVFLLHELGHVAGAYLIDWRIHCVMVWPLMYCPKPRKLTWSGQGGTGRLGGAVFATPVHWQDSRSGEAFFAVGGVAANLFTSAIAFALLEFVDQGLLSEALIEPIAIVSLMLGLLSLIPTWGKGDRRSDGARLIDLIRRRHRPQSDRVAWLLGSSMDGVPPKEWDPALIDQMETDVAAGTAPDHAYWLLHVRHLAFSDFVRARAVLEKLESHLDRLPDYVKIAKAFLLAHMDKDGAAARQLLNDVGRPSKRDFSYWRALALALDASGEDAEAVEAARQTRVFAKRNNVLLDDDDLSMLDAIERKAMAQLASPSGS